VIKMDTRKRLEESVKSVAKRINEVSDVSEYMKDALDVEVISGLNGKARNFKIMVSTGGPSITFDVGNAEVEGYWPPERTRMKVNKKKANMFFDYLLQLWRCGERT